MKVVIVAKTRQGSGACIGGITFDGRSLRLIPADQASNDHFNLEYEIGDVWDVEAAADENIIPPHVENVIVKDKRQLPPIADIITFVKTHMPPKVGDLSELYEGLTQATKLGALYITERTGIPSYSTMFWQPDKPLVRDDDAKRIRYRYLTEDGDRTLTFVGFQEPLPEIPAGTLLRVSLAHWWRPKEMPDGELRCYVQLSGWFLPASQRSYIGDLGSEVAPTQIQQTAVTDYDDPEAVLKQVFGFDKFRPLQADIIQNLLDGQDTLAVMPTGSGKSLCYQLPALLFPGLTVVVTPLISLMEDQVMQLRETGVPAVFLNSTLSYDQYVDVTARIRAGSVKLLYAAPETLLRPEALLLLEQVQVDCMTIDEAHCISEWGHDFRPEYRRLVEVSHRVPDVVCLATTATATQQVRDDIKRSLNIPDADEFVSSFNRTNLFLAVEPKSDPLTQIRSFLDKHPGESGIIYCATRRQVDNLTSRLLSLGWHALPYHAGLDDETRRDHQRRFSRDDVSIMVATIAFGMGINKSNVRFVVHHDLPKNLESYYQQIGRAGRDGLRADCLLLYSYSDVQTIRYFISEKEGREKLAAKLQLDAMLGFVEASACRRGPLLTYFGEPYANDSCGLCDNCTVERDDLVDLTIPAQKFLSCVKRTGEIFGMSHVIDVLRGSQSKKVLTRGHDRLSTYSIGREFSKKEWQYLARQFIQQKLMTQDMKHGSLRLTSKAYRVFRGEPVLGTLPERTMSAAAAISRPYDTTLFELLRARRKELADSDNVPPYVVFSDRALAEMATYFPQSRDAFANIHGVGEVKLERYASLFLPIIQAYAAENDITEKPKVVTWSSAPVRGSRRREVVEMANNGRSIADIARTFDVKPRTVINHLWKAIRDGQHVRVGDLLSMSQLSPSDQERVLEAFTEAGVERLRPVYDLLGESVSYDELHLLRLHFVARQMKRHKEEASSGAITDDRDV